MGHHLVTGLDPLGFTAELGVECFQAALPWIQPRDLLAALAHCVANALALVAQHRFQGLCLQTASLLQQLSSSPPGPLSLLLQLGIVIKGFNLGQKSLPGNSDLYLFQAALASRLLFGVDLLVVRKAHSWRGTAIRSSLSSRT